jgi:hypothetical protein
MDLGVGQVGIERSALVVGAAHEGDRPVGDLAVKAGPELRVVGGEHLGLGVLVAPVDRLGFQRHLGVPSVRGGGHRPIGEIGLHGPQDLIGGPGGPHGLVEAEIDRAALVGVAAQVPLAPHPGGIPGIRQGLGDGDLPAGQPVGAASDRYRMGARADGMPAGEQGRAAGGALGLDVEVQQPHTLASQGVDPRGLMRRAGRRPRSSQPHPSRGCPRRRPRCSAAPRSPLPSRHDGLPPGLTVRHRRVRRPHPRRVNHRPGMRRMSFRLSFHPVSLQRTGAHWLDGPPDLSCKETTRQHAVDDPLLSCNSRFRGAAARRRCSQPRLAP